MNCFETTLLNYLHGSKIKMTLEGFDMDGFKGAMQEEGRRRLEMIESIIYLDGDLMTDTEKVSAIKRYFQEEFCL